MMELLRNCSHGSEIATYLSADETGGKKIIKASTTANGIANLENEVEGWGWYQKLRYPEKSERICRITKRNNSYLQIRIDFIAGLKADYQKGLEGNAETLRAIISHYCQIWSYTSDLAPLHGDFSLDNIIINADGVHIIDWEHFNLKGAPWGFDLIYLLLETLYFGMQGRKEPTRNEIHFISRSIKTLDVGQPLPHWMTEYPLKFIRSFIADNSHLWGSQLSAFPSKFPVMTFSDEQVASIDGQISSASNVI